MLYIPSEDAKIDRLRYAAYIEALEIAYGKALIALSDSFHESLKELSILYSHLKRS